VSRRKKRRAAAGPTGLLLLDKPSGITSHDAVSVVRRLSGQPRVGHAGTLDPLATGLLPVLLGEATKLSPFATAADKAYETTARLGVRTDTLDADGAILTESPVDPALDAATVERALAAFRGAITQQVPRYSAVKVNGRRLHELARCGADVALPSREVVVHHLELLRFAPQELSLAVRCSKGTYVRQLVADLGDALGSGAHVTALRRTQVGPWHVRDATSLADLEASGTLPLLSPRQWAARALPCLECAPDQARRTRQGQTLSWQDLDHPRLATAERFALVQGPELVAIAEAEDGTERSYRLVRVFVDPATTTEETESAHD
jgi:tRNA pseudouridine55 synthase